MTRFELTLPWPHRDLSPNTILHWAIKAREKKAYKDKCFMLAYTLSRFIDKEAKKLPLIFIFHPPTRRHYDLDNLLARMKPGIDGIALAWGVNDKIFRPLTADFGDVLRDGKVVVQI